MNMNILERWFEDLKRTPKAAVVQAWIMENPNLQHTVYNNHKRVKNTVYVWVQYPHIPDNVTEKYRTVQYINKDGNWTYGGDV